MPLILYHHPFSSYCQKALIALREKQLDFEPFPIDLGDQRQRAEFAAIWPYAKFPVLADTARNVVLPEATLIVDYVDGLSSAGPRLVPTEAAEARNTRLLDRLLDNYLLTPTGKIVGDRLRPEGDRDPVGVAEARALIATTYDLLERRIGTSGWIAGPEFTLADCAAAPGLFYGAKVAPLDHHPRLEKYLFRTLDRPSFRDCLDDARDFRRFFPADPGDGPWIDEARVVAF